MIEGKTLPSLWWRIAQLRILCKLTVAFTLILSVLVEGCVAHVPTTSQPKENLEQYRKYLHQKVKICKKTDEIIVGYLQSAHEDSVVVSAEKDGSTKMSLAASEIRYLKRASNETATAVVLVSGILIFFFLASRLPAALGSFSGS